MVVDKISIVKQERLSNMGTQLAKACSLLNSSIIIFEDLLIIIVIGNIYQFPPIAWDKL